MEKIMFVLHKKGQCGVYEFGRNIADLLVTSSKYDFIVVECDSLEEYNGYRKQHNPSVIIFNYYPSIMPWVSKRFKPTHLNRNNIFSKKEIHIGIIHEITQSIADTALSVGSHYFYNKRKEMRNILFDYYIAPDPTLLLRNPLVYKTGRLVPTYQNEFPKPILPIIGSFGLATPNKGFVEIVKKVQEEFDEAIIRFNIASASVMKDGEHYGQELSAQCKSLIYKKGIQLEISHHFFSNSELLDFLAQNSINLFLYQDYSSRGISSTIDFALAVERPIAISKSLMFRHIAQAPICLEDHSIGEILKNGFGAIAQYKEDWSPENLIWEYERIIQSILKHENLTTKPVISFKNKRRRFFCKSEKHASWLGTSTTATEDSLKADSTLNYTPVVLGDNDRFNRILDNKARILYKPTIDFLFQLTPKTMAKKIPEANVQQGFVFDTVYRNLCNYKNPKILCVGSFEDTASMGIQRFGIRVEEVDPMLNYFLQEYYTKPTVKKSSYDLIFSTSVIEHDPDDESFIKCIDGLLAPGGMAIITCDYKDGWKPGDPKPDVDARFYTQKDLKERLLSYMSDCVLVDQPDWESPNLDFNFLGIYDYTFATFIVKKINS